MGEERFRKAFESMVEQAIALGAVKGYVVAIDSTAFKVKGCGPCCVYTFRRRWQGLYSFSTANLWHATTK